MNGSRNETSKDMEDAPINIAIPRIVQFWLYTVAEASSLACILFLLYYFLTDRKLRSAFYNHAIIVVLVVDMIYELTDIPWILHHYRFDAPWIDSPVFTRFWAFADYGIYAVQMILFAWATIERHILIFHDRWVQTRRRAFFFHYLPMIILPSYTVIYYSIGSFMIDCSGSFTYALLSGAPAPCLYNIAYLAKFDLLAHQIAPAIVIVLFSMALIFRVTWQKFRLHQPIQWRKHRKMTIQLLLISLVYLIFACPWSLVLLSYEFGVPRDVGAEYLLYSAFFSYYTVFTFPFVCCVSLSELRTKARQRLLWFRPRKTTIHPQQMRAVPTGSRVNDPSVLHRTLQ